MISVRRLTAIYRGGRLVDDISLDIAPGELVVVHGPRAATGLLLRVLSGLVRPHQGGVHLEDGAAATLLELRRAVAYVSSDRVFESSLRLDEFLGFIMAARSIPERTDLVVDRVRRFQIDLRCPPSSLSVEDRCKVSLALALASSARLLAVDRALDQVSATTRQELIEALHEAARAGSSVIVSTGDVTPAVEATRTFELAGGRLVSSAVEVTT